MKMLHQNSKKRKKIFIFLSAFFALFLALFVFKSFPPKFVLHGAFYVAQPFVHLKASTVSFFESNISILKNKKSLEAENIFLKQKIMKLELEKDFSEKILRENEEFKRIFSINTDQNKDFIVASILTRPGYGIYNSIVIDAGLEDGVEKGMQVSAFGNALLGYVFDVTDKTSKVRLISSPDEETNIFIEEHMAAIAVGIGGENLLVSLPRESGVAVGDKITSLGGNSLFLGIVEDIIREPADPLERIIFRLPINIQELERVYLLK